jgi:hypothetical protein
MGEEELVNREVGIGGFEIDRKIPHRVMVLLSHFFHTITEPFFFGYLGDGCDGWGVGLICGLENNVNLDGSLSLMDRMDLTGPFFTSFDTGGTGCWIIGMCIGLEGAFG